MRDLLLGLRRALDDLRASIGTPAPAGRIKHAGGRPRGSVGKRWRNCLRAVCGADGATTFGISDLSRTYGKPIAQTTIQHELGTLIRAGHITPRAGSSFQVTEQGLAMLEETRWADRSRSP
jgi:hypothetical protein